MAANTNITIPANTWTMVTASNVSSLRLQIKGLFACQIQATSNTTAPTNTLGTIDMDSGEVMAADITLAQLFPGVTGAARVWVYCEHANEVSVSYA